MMNILSHDDLIAINQLIDIALKHPTLGGLMISQRANQLAMKTSTMIRMMEQSDAKQIQTTSPLDGGGGPQPGLREEGRGPN